MHTKYRNEEINNIFKKKIGLFRNCILNYKQRGFQCSGN